MAYQRVNQKEKEKCNRDVNVREISTLLMCMS